MTQALAEVWSMYFSRSETATGAIGISVELRFDVVPVQPEKVETIYARAITHQTSSVTHLLTHG